MLRCIVTRMPESGPDHLRARKLWSYLKIKACLLFSMKALGLLSLVNSTSWSILLTTQSAKSRCTYSTVCESNVHSSQGLPTVEQKPLSSG